MHKSLLSRVIFFITLITMCIFGIWLALTPYNADIVDLGNESNNYSHEDFYTEYLDLVLQKEQQAENENEKILDNSITVDDALANSVSGGIVNFNDLTGLARSVAKNFKNSKGQYDYSQSSGKSQWPGSITIGDKVVPNDSYSRRDCSMFVSLMCYFMGADSTFICRNSAGFNCYPEVKTSTFEGAKVGDVIAGPGHVEIIVKIDSDNVYFGNCGSSKSIQKTAEQGYSHTLKKTASIQSWHKGTCHLYRPMDKKTK